MRSIDSPRGVRKRGDMKGAARRHHDDEPSAAPDDARLERMLAAMASSVRLGILRQLAMEGQVCACGFDIQALVAQSTVSHHLRVLREAGIVRAERRGTFVYYSVEGGALDRILEVIGDLRPPEAPADTGRAIALEGQCSCWTRGRRRFRGSGSGQSSR